MSGSKYSRDQIEQARAMWEKGYSAHEIAVRLNFPSRNAVISVARRNGFLQHVNSRARVESFLNGGSDHIPAARTCQYPYGDPKAPDFRFCGDPAKPGSSYCATHHALCYDKPGERRPETEAEGGR